MMMIMKMMVISKNGSKMTRTMMLNDSGDCDDGDDDDHDCDGMMADNDDSEMTGD